MLQTTNSYQRSDKKNNNLTTDFQEQIFSGVYFWIIFYMYGNCFQNMFMTMLSFNTTYDSLNCL